ncbi:MAG: hypothetical protein V8Q90_04705 [Bacilli bacterium]
MKSTISGTSGVYWKLTCSISISPSAFSRIISPSFTSSSSSKSSLTLLVVAKEF